MPQVGNLSYLGKLKGTYEPIRRANNSTRQPWKSAAFLWGDPMYVISKSGGRCQVSAKGHILEVAESDLMDSPILQVFQIDCGQGDSTLIQFPWGKWGRWMIIDGGPPRSWSNTGKIAADFLYWKIFVDFSWRSEFAVGPRPFHFDDVICSHPDYDHFGGLMELNDLIPTQG